MSRRALLGSAGLVVSLGGLASCRPLLRGRSRASTSAQPTGATAKDPDTSLVVASVGTSYSLAATYEAQIAAAITEACIDVNTSGGVFDRDVRLLPRVMVDKPDQDMTALVRALADQGANAAIVSCSDEQLTAAMEHFAAADIAVISPNSTSMSVRADATLDHGLLFRLAPNDDALARMYAEASQTGGSDGTPLTVALCTRQDTAQGASLLASLQERLNGAGGRVDHYPHPAAEFDADGIVDAILASRPAVVALAGGPETGSILRSYARKNLDQRGQPILRLDVQLGYYCSLAYGRSLPDKALQGFRGARMGQPVTEAGGDFYDEMLNANTGFVQAGCDFAAEAYDAFLLIALGAQRARSAAGSQIATAIPTLLGKGDACELATQCLTPLRNGGSVSYAPRSGELELGKDRDPARAAITTFAYSESNQPQQMQATSISPTS